MPWVRFTAAYDHAWPSRAVTAYPAGYVGNVKRVVSARAIAAGKAEPHTPPRLVADGGVSE